MKCDEKTRLAAEFEKTTAKFSEAVSELHRRIGICPKEEYKLLNRMAKAA